MMPYSIIKSLRVVWTLGDRELKDQNKRHALKSQELPVLDDHQECNCQHS